MEIRPLEKRDLDLLSPLIDQFVSANKTLTFRPDYRSVFRDSARKVLNDKDAVIFVAEQTDEIVGLIAGRIIDNGPIILPEKNWICRFNCCLIKVSTQRNSKGTVGKAEGVVFVQRDRGSAALRSAG